MNSPVNRERTGKTAQLSGSVGVSPNVSSVAISAEVLGGHARAHVNPPARSFPLQELSDAEIMLRVKEGDEGAISFLVEKYRRAMVAFMYRTTHNAAVAEELAQEVFLRVYRSRETYKADAKFSTWLYRIATNLAVNYARDTRHERPEVTVRLDEPDTDTGMTLDVADARPNVEQNLLRRERLAAIRQHVQRLPERQRMAVLMHKYQGMDYRQIGEVLHLSEAATKSLLFRAYETLRDRLKQFV
jgi:RNA polymerase sigma-70 factor (ECF subfamily)